MGLGFFFLRVRIINGHGHIRSSTRSSTGRRCSYRDARSSCQHAYKIDEESNDRNHNDHATHPQPPVFIAHGLHVRLPEWVMVVRVVRPDVTLIVFTIVYIG